MTEDIPVCPLCGSPMGRIDSSGVLYCLGSGCIYTMSVEEVEP